MSINYLQSANLSNQDLDISLYPQSVSGIITGENRHHSYSIKLNSRSYLSVSLENSLGNTDIELVDSQGGVIAGSYQRRRRDEKIDQTLDPGEYQIHVFGVGFRDTGYQLHVSQSPIASTNVYKWDGLFQDWEITQEISTSLVDGQLDRNDAIAIFNQVMDGGVVDAIEFADLQTLVNLAVELNIPESVRVLVNKVINGDPANTSYQNQPLGNLNIGSSSTHLQNLVDKWFFGRDRPITTYDYQYASGELFQNGISYEDISQGQINNCYFLAGLALTAIHAPDIISNMLSDNGDGTYTVKFWRDRIADYITVDRYLPTTGAGNLIYASQGEKIYNPDNELWVALLEKAYAQINASGWINQEPENSYISIGEGGYISDALQHITGQQTSLGNILNFQSILEAITSGAWVGIGTKTNPVNPNLVASHAYALIDYDADTQKFKLFNPWGINNTTDKPGVLELTWSEMLANVSYWDKLIG